MAELSFSDRLMEDSEAFGVSFSDEGRRLSTQLACLRPCGAGVCGDVNTTLSCSELAEFDCLCQGCCYTEDPGLGAGGFAAIFLGVIWILSFAAFVMYRRLAHKEMEHAFAGVDAMPNVRRSITDEEAAEAEYSSEQVEILRRRHRYRISLLNLLLPFISFCCPGLHRYFTDSYSEFVSEVRRSWQSFQDSCREAKEGVKQGAVEAVQLTRQATRDAVNVVDRRVVRARTRAARCTQRLLLPLFSSLLLLLPPPPPSSSSHSSSSHSSSHSSSSHSSCPHSSSFH
jgi:hypothetical protein